jgi:hypothetical protein
MATTTVGIVFEVINRGAAGVASINTTLGSVNRELRSLRQMASVVGIDLSLRAVVGAVKDIGGAAMEAERAQNELRVALDRTGDATTANIAAARQFAAQIEEQTTYSDTQVLGQMAYAKTLGVTTDQLDETAVAAIGLASAYGMDLERATRTVALASAGELESLKRMGIVLDENASDQQRLAQVMALGTMGFAKARAAVDTAEGALGQFKNTWHSTKAALGEPFLEGTTQGFQGLTALLKENRSEISRWAKDTAEGLGVVIKAIQDARTAISGTAGQSVRTTYQNMGPDMRQRVRTQYEQKTGETFGNWSQPFDFTASKIIPPQIRYSPAALLLRRIETGAPTDEAKVLEIINRMRTEQAAAVEPRLELAGTGGLPSAGLTGAAATLGLSTLTPEQEKAREQVDRLNQSLREQTTAAWLTAQGHEHAAKTVQFETEVRKAYAGDIEKQKQLIDDYRTTVNSLTILEERAKREAAQKDFNAELDLTVTAMRQEANLAGLTNKERERETIIQNAANEAVKRGVDFTADQEELLRKVVDQLQRARDLADMRFGEGWSLGIKQMQEELLTTAQISRDLSLQMRDGIVGSLTDAIFRSEDLGDSLRRVGLEMLEYAMREAWLKPMVTQGMGFGTQLLGKLPGLAASLFPAGAPAGGVSTSGTGGYVDVSGINTVTGATVRIPRAGGGRVSPGTAYWVGEQGPEPFIPDEAGTILPTGFGRGMGRGGKGLDLSEVVALLRQLVAKEMKIDATIVDGRDLLTRGDMKGREGEELVMYHTGRNG